MNNDIAHIDLYSILELTNSATTDQIKKKYRELSRKYHPDKGGNTKVYEMITRAYNVLSNSKQRADYDNRCNKMLEKIQETNYVNLKTTFKNLMNEMKIEEDPDAENKFKKGFDELDLKHNYKREDAKNTLNKKEMTKKLKELELSREQDDIEIDEPIFNNNNFTIDKFNAAFDVLEKKKKEIIEFKEPVAWNADATQCALFDPSTYNNIYAEDNFIGDNICSSINQSNFTVKKIDINEIDSAPYYTNHNVVDVNYDIKMEEHIKERERFDRNIKKI